MRLPPLNAVRAFEAVCRHGSILKAAEELNVVRGAVRQQIATLENHLGRKLFTRDGRRLVPTVQASAFAAAAGIAFDILQRAVLELEGAEQNRIRLGVPSAFAVWWLMPRVADMQASVGDTAVEIVPMTVVEPLQMHPELDAVIMGGEYRPAPGITALRFMEDEFGPVSTPSLAATLSKDPAAMGALTMLASRSVPKLWDEWFAESGTRPVVFSRVQEFEDLLLALGAARSGLGIALAPRASIEDDLERRHLVAPYGFISRPSGYSFCCRTPDAKRPAFGALSGWLLRCGTSG
ncbi:LysR substrate-binding domain-containing protein [Rhizobium anhuiense]|uniref:LysR family transcriptional regulator n=1 Tax=Rhizobium anhuiense TaxID=1184720 RepID=A0A3S0XMS2_9HYPH|nr:LysR substrate-binding domain-containing protein [Rhizobium anhuiense]RUM01998.1 LysR family transcriptional regulator [Rhizobium anhuiense]GGD80672.1 LysR family transcriptional regulator [Rhizobium anhuiense]